MPDNTAAVAEAWAVMQPMHYTTRFRLYAGWLRVLREDPVLRASQRLAVAEAKRVLRRIHVPEDKKERREVLRPFGRRLGKVRLGRGRAVLYSVIARGKRGASSCLFVET